MLRLLSLAPVGLACPEYFASDPVEDVIAVLDPLESPIVQMLVEGNPVHRSSISHEWLEDKLEPWDGSWGPEDVAPEFTQIIIKGED